jgi:cyclase
MLNLRLIPCLDLRDGRIVKGVNFKGLRDAGDPLEQAVRYAEEGADELVLLDVSATLEGRATNLEVLSRIREALAIPLTLGGGLREVEDARRFLAAGADKVAVNSAAVDRPELLEELAAAFGSQCVVLSLDAGRSGDSWEVVTHAGTRPRGIDAPAWAAEAARRGAGEILATSVDRDGTGAGYDLGLLRALRAATWLPLIASGGVASPEDLVDGATAGASGLLLASLLHDGKADLRSLKDDLRQRGLPLRP